MCYKMSIHEWKPTSTNEKVGVVIYNFHANSISYGLSLKVGEVVQLFEECSEWFKGRLLRDQNQKGIFPKNCVVLKDAVITNPGPFENAVPICEPIVEEVTSVLRQWGDILKELFVAKKLDMFIVLKGSMLELIEHRREIIGGKLTKDQQCDIKEWITEQIDDMNNKLGLDLVPRINGEIVNERHTSVVELYKIHLKSVAKTLKSHNSLRFVSTQKPLLKMGTIKRQSTSFAVSSTHHVFLVSKSMVCNIGEPSTLMFSLYDATNQTYISENYIVRLSKHGMPLDVEMLGKQLAIFSELKANDLLKDVYLVCKIFREGKLVADSKRTANAVYRRPYGAGVVQLSTILCEDNEDETEFYFPIYSCNELEFFMIEEFIIKKQTGKYTAFGSNAYGVCVSLKRYSGDIDKIIKEKGDCTITPRLGFPEVIMPGYVRNEFFVTLLNADFEKGSKSSGKNIEMALCVVSNTGQVFNDCMYIGCGDGSVSEYRSYVLYHTNNPHWNETIKISLPNEQFHVAHLRFTFSHCSRNEGKVKGEKMFGFSFLRLLGEEQTVIPDNTYDIFIHKVDRTVNFMQVRSYLRLPSSPADLLKQNQTGHSPPRSQSPKETLTVKTCLCSTKLTQNSDIQNLLRWRQVSSETVLNALESLLSVSPDEIVKFLQDVFDALFKILSEKPEEFSMPVFKLLVSIIKIVDLKKFQLFKSTLVSYLDCHFSAALAYRTIIESLCYIIAHYDMEDMKATFCNTMQSLQYIFKIIVRSYLLHHTNSKTPELAVAFKSMLENTFESLALLMSSTSEMLKDSKMKVLNAIPEIIEDLLQVLSEEEISKSIEEIVFNIPKTSSSRLLKSMLKCLQKIVAGKLFTEKDSRAVLLFSILQQCASLMEKKQEISSCLDLLADIITSFQHQDRDLIWDDILLLTTSVLGTVLNVLLTVDRKGLLTGLSVVCLFGILKLMDEVHFQRYVETFKKKGDLRDFLKKLIVGFKELLTLDIFPKDWFLLKTVGNDVILTTMKYLSKTFIDYFLHDDHFVQQLWQNYFQLAVLFLKQPSLCLESFTLAKREKVLNRYGDMRLTMGFEILSMWNILDDKKKYFTLSLIGPFLEMVLIPEQELRKATIPIFYDIMAVEFANSLSIKKVETEILEQLEVFVSHSKGDLEFGHLLNEIMASKFEVCKDETLKIEGMKLIVSITELLKRLLDYRATSKEDSNTLEKMICTVRLMEFYKDFDRQNMYIRNIDKLVKLHVSSDNYTEAGFTLLLYANLLERLNEKVYIILRNVAHNLKESELKTWSNNKLPPFLDYPKQTEGERKEMLYREIINFFDKGKTWEPGIELCKELATQYETRLFDYRKLSDILRRLASFYDSVIQQMRPAPTYFRVSFYGCSFPHYLKNEVLVCRGAELETLAGFTSRINTDFPNAEIMYQNNTPNSSIVDGVGQYIQIRAVNPVVGEVQMLNNKNIDERISSYYKSNEVNQFVVSRPFHKGEKDRSNEFKTLWLERIMHWTERKFPGILKWSKIVSTKKVELKPIENAIESIQSKNNELVDMIDTYQSNKLLNVNQLSMVLNGVIDANVNGGIANYQNAFLTDEYLSLNPEDSDCVDRLRDLLHDQSRILSEGLDTHESFVSDLLRPFHDKMLMMYSAMKTSIETGQPMDSVLAIPSSLQINSTLRNDEHSSPKVSPGGRSISKSPSDLSDYKKTSSGKHLSTSLQSMFRRSSHPSFYTDPISTSADNLSKKNARRISTASIESEEDCPIVTTTIEPPTDISYAAMKRLGLNTTPLAASASSLDFIKEEGALSLPSKRKGSKRLSNHSLNRMSASDTLPDFSTENITDSERLYANVGRNSITINEDDFYVSPKQLVPFMLGEEQPPPLPATRKRFSTEDISNGIDHPAAGKFQNRELLIDEPPPLPLKNFRVKSGEGINTS